MEELVLLLAKAKGKIIFWLEMLQVAPSSAQVVGAVILTRD